MSSGVASWSYGFSPCEERGKRIAVDSERNPEVSNRLTYPWSN